MADRKNTHGQEDLEGADNAVALKDVGTGWRVCHPTAPNHTERAVEALQMAVGSEALQMLVGSEETVKNFYTDAAPRLNEVAKNSGGDTRRPFRVVHKSTESRNVP